MNRPNRSRPSLSTAERLQECLHELLAGRAVDRVWRPAHAELLIRFSGRDKRRLWIDLDDDRPRWILTLDWPQTPDRPDDRTIRLRSALEGWRIERVELHQERALAIRLRKQEGARTLRLQLAGRYLNATVEGDELTGPVSLLLNRPAVDDESPPLQPGAEPNELEEDQEVWLSKLEIRWLKERAWLGFFREQAEQRRLLRDALKRTRRALKNIGRDLERSRGAEENRRRGDLIKTMLGRIPTGSREVEAVDYTAPDCPRVTVELDPALDGVANMERYYKLYRRFHDARQDIEARHASESSKETALATLLDDLDSISEGTPEQALEAVRSCRLRAEPLGLRGRVAQRRGRRATSTALPYRTFLSTSGARILVGRSAKHNDALTFRVARGRDLWLHARDVAGSHVVIPLERGAEVTQETLLDAAHLALHFSQARGEPAGDVQWTERKNIRRVPGAGAGRVTVAASKTLRVAFDPDRLESLYARRPVGEQ